MWSTSTTCSLTWKVICKLPRRCMERMTGGSFPVTVTKLQSRKSCSKSSSTKSSRTNLISRWCKNNTIEKMCPWWVDRDRGMFSVFRTVASIIKTLVILSTSCKVSLSRKSTSKTSTRQFKCRRSPDPTLTTLTNPTSTKRTQLMIWFRNRFIRSQSPWKCGQLRRRARISKWRKSHPRKNCLLNSHQGKMLKG